MLRVITLVCFNPELSPEQAYGRWQTHTDTWDRRDHPEIISTRLVLFGEGQSCEFDGFAETLWPDQAAFQRAADWYEQPASARHAADLASFMDMERSRTLVIREDSIIDGKTAPGV